MVEKNSGYSPDDALYLLECAIVYQITFNICTRYVSSIGNESTPETSLTDTDKFYLKTIYA